MGRISASNARGMYNAYASVYEGYGKKKEGGCVDKEDKGKHNCAKKVCHEQFGEGTCIFGEHAVPDENGFVSHYDVMFEHGVERNVPVEDMEVLVLVEHPMEGHRYEGEQLDEGDLEQLQEFGIGPVRERIPMSSGRLTIPGAKREAEQRRKDEADSKAQAAQLGDDAARETGVPRGQIPPGATLTRKPAGMSAAELKAAQDAANKAREQGKLSDLRGGSVKPAKPAPVPAKPTSAKPTPAKPAPVLSMKNGVTGTGVGDKFVARKWTDAERARYTARGGKVSTTAKPAPANTTPAVKPEPAVAIPRPTGDTQGPAAKPAPATTPAAKPEQALSKLPGGNYSAAATKLMSQRTKNILGTTKTPATRLGGARERMLNQDLDLFDIVKGHLLDEGYAETEEAALAIMSNMSEDWRNEIIESSCGGGHSKKKKKKSGY